MIDCLPWNHKPDKGSQISGYMCLSRVQQINDLHIVQPYSPALFSQGEILEPQLLLDFQRGTLRQDSLKKAWTTATAGTNKKIQWPADMELYCRGCSSRAGEDISRPLSHFTSMSDASVWDEVIAKGMERFCKRCSNTEPVEAVKNISPTVQAQSLDCAWCTALQKTAKTALQKKVIPKGTLQWVYHCVLHVRFCESNVREVRN